MKAAALLVSVAMLGCFPNNARHRTIAKYVEGGALVAGIAISAVANTGADCDEMMMPGPNVDNTCKTTARILSTTGMVLILGGLLGFIATISTAEDAEVQKTSVTVVTDENEKAKLKLPPGVTPPAQAKATPPAADDASAPTETPAPAPTDSGANSTAAPQQ